MYSEYGKGVIRETNFEGNMNNEHNSIVYSSNRECILTFESYNNFNFIIYYCIQKKQYFYNVYENV